MSSLYPSLPLIFLSALELKSDSPYPQLAESGILLSQFVLGFDGYLKMRCRYPYLTRASYVHRLSHSSLLQCPAPR